MQIYHLSPVVIYDFQSMHMYFNFSDHDEGISLSGESPGASYDPLSNCVPAFLSSIWSDLDDPKSEPCQFPRRAASLGSNPIESKIPVTSGKFIIVFSYKTEAILFTRLL